MKKYNKLSNYQSNYKPQEYYTPKREVSVFKYLTILFAVFMICGTFYYVAQKGWLGTNVDQNVSVEPETNVNNEFDFSPETQNNFKNNYTIINEINILSDICGDE